MSKAKFMSQNLLVCMILKLLNFCSIIPCKLFGLSSAGSCKISCLRFFLLTYLLSAFLSVGLKMVSI
jgi:hypothetical protein